MAKGSITVVGLGPGAAGEISVESMNLLAGGGRLVLRTGVHPSVSELEKQQINFETCDRFYKEDQNFEQVYQHIVEYLLRLAEQEPVVYAVPGSPLVAEKTVVLLRDAAAKSLVDLKILPAMSFLDLAYVKLNLDPINGLRIIDAQDFGALADAGQYPLMITQVYSELVASDVKISLMDVLRDDAQVYFLRNLGLPDEECREIALFELDRQKGINHLTSVFVPVQEQLEDVKLPEDEELGVMDPGPLVEVMKTLREPGGCPWDREQTHSSIRANMIEEVYEFIEAVDTADFEGMKEELGDILMQVVFHARLAEEQHLFSMQDVVEGVTEKLIHRHPHVYGTVEVAGSDEVLSNWEEIKKAEKKERVRQLDGIYKGLPALLRAHKLQRRAAKVGFDWKETDQVYLKVQEEMQELQQAILAKDSQAMEQEYGDLLFALVNYARHLGLEGETALNGSNNRFVCRFNHVEDCVHKSGRDWSGFTLKELDEYWDEAKKREKSGQN